MGKIVVINGYQRSGKDTFIDICKKHVSVQQISIIDPVKRIAEECEWHGSKDPKDRKFLCSLKDLLTEYNDLPFKIVCYCAEGFYENSQDDILFVTMRQPEDIERYKRLYPEAVTLFIDRLDAKLENSQVDDSMKNDADDGVENYNYDYYISNNSTLEEFEEGAVTFLKDLEVM